EVIHQIEFLRRAREGTGDAPGHVHFRMGALTAQNTAVGAELEQRVYADRAIVPASPWLGARAPAAPAVSVLADGGSMLTLTPADSVTVRWWVVQARTGERTWRTFVLPAGGASLRLDELRHLEPSAIAVRAISATGVLS